VLIKTKGVEMARKVLAVLVCSGFLFISLGCQENRKTKMADGAIAGGLLGAAAGGIIGGDAAGAGIGAAVGAAAGGLIGSQMPREGEAKTEAPETTTAQQPANPNQMSILQVVELTKQGTAENVIIEKIRTSNSKFTLTPADVEYLKKEGVSQKVIDAMQVI